MSGVLWATVSGIGFGVFQSLNRRAIRGIEDPYVSTFVQLAVATAILVVASLVSEDLGQLGDASAGTIAIFALAGVVHFVLGWLLLNVSQARIGASRTAPLITLTPLFGTALAVLLRGELPSAGALAAIVPIMVGAWLLASRGSGGVAIERDSIFAFGTAFMWALSAVLTVEALEGLDSPLLGVTLGLLAATAALGGALVARGSLGPALRSIARNTLALPPGRRDGRGRGSGREPRERAGGACACADDGGPPPRAGGRAHLARWGARGRRHPGPDRDRGMSA